VKLTRRIVCAAPLTALTPVSAHADRPLITGVNLAGLEFGSGRLPGEADRDFVAATSGDLDYYREPRRKSGASPLLVGAASARTRC
jgi:hypothetical protein